MFFHYSYYKYVTCMMEEEFNNRTKYKETFKITKKNQNQNIRVGVVPMIELIKPYFCIEICNHLNFCLE